MRWTVLIKNRHSRRPRGMALILAMVIAAIVLALGINITNITSKEIFLSSFSGGSDIALYEADAALECAEYYNVGNSSTPTPKVFARTGGGDTGDPVNCLGSTVTVGERTVSIADPAVTTFWIPGTATSTVAGPCAFVSITNQTIGAGPQIAATYSVDGYNTCISSNPRRVQRSLQVNATLSL